MPAPPTDPNSTASVHGAWHQRLVRCIRVLGWRNGWRYWRIQNWAIKNPQGVLDWAEACEAEADKIESRDPLGAGAFRHWAKRL